MGFVSGIKEKLLRCSCRLGPDGNPERNTTLRKIQKATRARNRSRKALRNVGEEVGAHGGAWCGSVSRGFSSPLTLPGSLTLSTWPPFCGPQSSPW